MDAYGKKVYFELKSLREKAEDEHLAALVALNAALDKHGPYVAGSPTHPALLSAYARQEAAELVESAVTMLVRDWLAPDSRCASMETGSIIEAPEAANA